MMVNSMLRKIKETCYVETMIKFLCKSRNTVHCFDLHRLNSSGSSDSFGLGPPKSPVDDDIAS